MEGQVLISGRIAYNLTPFQRDQPVISDTITPPGRIPGVYDLNIAGNVDRLRTRLGSFCRFMSRRSTEWCNTGDLSGFGPGA